MRGAICYGHAFPSLIIGAEMPGCTGRIEWLDLKRF